MTKVTDILEQIQNTLSNAALNDAFPHCGSLLDMATETLGITIVDTQIRFIIKEEITSSDDSSTYSRTFDATNINWQANNDFNNIFLQCQERYLNHLLQTQGHVFLNDVYDNLGFDRTSDGAIVGWIYNEDDEVKTYIDFGLTSDNPLLISFNVQGVIYDKI